MPRWNTTLGKPGAKPTPEWECDIFFDCANWTVGVSWAFGVMLISLGPLVIIFSER